MHTTAFMQLVLTVMLLCVGSSSRAQDSVGQSKRSRTFDLTIASRKRSVTITSPATDRVQVGAGQPIRIAWTSQGFVQGDCLELSVNSGATTRKIVVPYNWPVLAGQGGTLEIDLVPALPPATLFKAGFPYDLQHRPNFIKAELPKSSAATSAELRISVASSAAVANVFEVPDFGVPSGSISYSAPRWTTFSTDIGLFAHVTGEHAIDRKVNIEQLMSVDWDNARPKTFVASTLLSSERGATHKPSWAFYQNKIVTYDATGKYTYVLDRDLTRVAGGIEVNATAEETKGKSTAFKIAWTPPPGHDVSLVPDVNSHARLPQNPNICMSQGMLLAGIHSPGEYIVVDVSLPVEPNSTPPAIFLPETLESGKAALATSIPVVGIPLSMTGFFGLTNLTSAGDWLIVLEGGIGTVDAATKTFKRHLAHASFPVLPLLLERSAAGYLLVCLVKIEEEGLGKGQDAIGIFAVVNEATGKVSFSFSAALGSADYRLAPTSDVVTASTFDERTGISRVFTVGSGGIGPVVEFAGVSSLGHEPDVHRARAFHLHQHSYRDVGMVRGRPELYATVAVSDDATKAAPFPRNVRRLLYRIPVLTP